jgi:tetratricopeptide (TPR) repeat protein
MSPILGKGDRKLNPSCFMLLDAQGLEVTTDDLEAVRAIDQFADQLLGYGNNPEVILQAVETDPTAVLTNAHAAALHLFAETADAPAQAAPYLKKAQANLATATARERLYVEAIAAWAEGEIDRALAYHETLADSYPRDVISVQIGQYHYFNLGDSQGLLNLIDKVLPANRENHYIHGMQAFGLEQCHRLEAAEQAGRRAAEMNRQDPWAHHAVAHVLETQGRLEEGIAWMESFSDTWEVCGSFYTHNWWHVALYYLDQEDFSKVLELYDTKIWGRAVKDYSQCHLDAIALLLRLELRGVEVGNRWQEVGAYIPAHIHDHVLSLIDVHYIYALARAGQTELATEMLQSIQTFAETVKPPMQATWAEVTLPTAAGMLAHAVGNWSAAIANLSAALPRLHQIGGSHAQRDLFEQVYLDALIQANQDQQARNLLEKRVQARPAIPLIHRQLTSTYQTLGLLFEANQATHRANELSQRYRANRTTAGR